jgi:hypothetical protein
MNAFRTGLLLLLILSSVLTTSLGLYASYPWEHASYMTLLAMLVYAVTPCIGAIFLSRLFLTDTKARTVFLIGACIISGSGVYACLDSLVLNGSPLGGLVFIAAPTYEWFALAVLTISCLAMRNMRADRADGNYDTRTRPL